MDKKIKVSFYSGYRGEESPRTFFIDNEKVDVLDYVIMWIEERETNREQKRFFKVRGSDGFVHTVYYDFESMEWFYRGREKGEVAVSRR